MRFLNTLRRHSLSPEIWLSLVYHYKHIVISLLTIISIALKQPRWDNVMGMMEYCNTLIVMWWQLPLTRKHDEHYMIHPAQSKCLHMIIRPKNCSFSAVRSNTSFQARINYQENICPNHILLSFLYFYNWVLCILNEYLGFAFLGTGLQKKFWGQKLIIWKMVFTFTIWKLGI